MLGTTGDKEHEWEFRTFSNGEYHVENLNLGTVHALVKTIDDDEVWENHIFFNTGLGKVLEGIDDKRSELRYKRSGKDVRVFIDHGFHKFSDARDDNGDLVGDGSNKSLGIAMQGVATEKEEARKEEPKFFAVLCDSLRDGGLPSASGTVKPHYESVCVNLLHDPVHDLLEDGFAGVFVTFRWVTSFQGVMKCTWHRCFF